MKFATQPEKYMYSFFCLSTRCLCTSDAEDAIGRSVAKVQKRYHFDMQEYPPEQRTAAEQPVQELSASSSAEQQQQQQQQR